MAIQSIYQNSKKWLREDFLSEDDFGAVLVTFCCYDYGTNSSETVEEIATDQKDYHKSSLGIITNPPSINNSIKVGYQDTSGVAKKTHSSCTEKIAITRP